MKYLLTLTVGLLIAGSGISATTNVIGGIGIASKGAWWDTISITSVNSPTYGDQLQYNGVVQVPSQSPIGYDGIDIQLPNHRFGAAVDPGEWNTVYFRLSPDFPYIETREFRVNADQSMDFRNPAENKFVLYNTCVPNTVNNYTNIADGTIIRFYAFIDPNHMTGSAGPAGPPGNDGAPGSAGADGGQGAQGTIGPAGADAPCIECVDLSSVLVDFTCKILAANPPTNELDFDADVDSVLNAMTATINVCGGDKAACLAQIKADIDAAK
jgi:hypothetical protein